MKLRKGDKIRSQHGTEWIVWSTNSRRKPGKPIEMRRHDGRFVVRTFASIDDLEKTAVKL